MESLVEESFVGRADELARLDSYLASAATGDLKVVLITGDPGIGKTRLANEVARQAQQRGFVVAWGRCWEDDAAPAYWPWIQILRALGDETLPPELAQLLPEYTAVAAPEAEATRVVALLPSPIDAERSRFLLFDALARFLERRSQQNPLLLLLDDMHAADLPALALLRFIARNVASARVAIVVTQREAEIQLDPQRAEHFASLGRSAGRIELYGWPRGEVGHFLEQVLGREPSEDLTEAVAKITGGNPLFVEGYAQQLRRRGANATDPLPPPPAGVRATLRERLRLLPSFSRELLDVAAVAGLRFDPHLMAHVLDRSREQVLDGLMTAVRARLVRADERPTGRYAFDHPLIRETVYLDLSPGHRMRLHEACAVALCQLHAARLDEHASEIVHHYVEAAVPDNLPRVVDFTRRAAARAMAQCAYEDAARLLARALEAARGFGMDAYDACELQVSLAEARLRAGQTRQARDICAQAAKLARAIGAGALHARAALFFGGVVVGVGVPDPELLDLLEESLELLPEDDLALRAIVSARLAVRLHAPMDGDRRLALSADALRLAHEAGSDEALAYALDARHVACWDKADLAQQLDVADGMVKAARGCGNRELVLHGVHLRVSAYLEAGDIGGVDREIAHYEALAGEIQQPHYAFRVRCLRSMRALMNGEFDRAGMLAAEAVDLGEQAQSPLAIAFAATHALAFDRIRGRHGEAEAIARPLVELLPTIAGVRLGLAALYADFGRSQEAEALYSTSSAQGFADVPRDNNWLLSMSLAAEICVHLGRRDDAEKLYAALRPFAHRHAVGGSGWTSLGCVARALGLLAALLERHEEAEAFLKQALQAHHAMGAPAFVVFSQLDLAEFLARRSPGAEAVRTLATSARDVAIKLGMDRHAARADALAATKPPGADVEKSATFRREGDVWYVAFGGGEARLKDIRGLSYLARLLAAPGEGIHCLDLVGGGTGRPVESAGMPPLDERARREYRQRLRELHADIDAAEADHDLGRVAHARHELELLERELSRAFGLGGRERGEASTVERARVTVTKSIRLALERLALQIPSLGEHLRATLRTGTWCIYLPDPRLTLRWHVG